MSDNSTRNEDKRGRGGLILLLALPFLLLALLGAMAYMYMGDFSYQGGALMVPVLEQGVAVSELDRREAYPEGPLPPGLMFDSLLLEKGRHRLTAFAGGKEVRVYLVAIGANPQGHKEEEGDRRTPEGDYVIDDKSDKSAYHKNLGISYPNEEDRRRAEEAGVSPGGNIKIHGLSPDSAHVGSAHRLTDWTHGCIAVTNEEMDEIFTHTPVGVPIRLKP